MDSTNLLLLLSDYSTVIASGAGALIVLILLLNALYKSRKNSRPRMPSQDRRTNPRSQLDNVAVFEKEIPAWKKQATIARPLLSESEKEFFHMLVQALPDYFVFTQVSLNALVMNSSNIWSREARLYIRKHLNTCYVDFVLCRKSDFHVFAVLGYGVRGQKSQGDAERDRVLKSVGYRVERFTPGVTVEIIKRRLKTATLEF